MKKCQTFAEYFTLVRQFFVKSGQMRVLSCNEIHGSNFGNGDKNV